MIYSLCVQYLQVIERTQNLLWNVSTIIIGESILNHQHYIHRLIDL